SEADKAPAETSERVKAVALESLQHCLARFCDRKPVGVEPPEKPPEKAPEVVPSPTPVSARAGGGDVLQPVAFDPAAAERRATAEAVAGAQRTLAEVAGTAQTPRPPATGRRNLYHLLVDAAAP